MDNDTIAMRERIEDWFDALDPSRLRFHNALRATMAMFVTWIIVYLTTQEIGWYFLGVGIFALLSSFICDLVMNQVPLDSRVIALPLVFIPMVLAIFVVALIERDPFWTAVVIILTFYSAYFFRRFGVIPFLLGFTAVTVFYISFLLGINQAVMDSLVFTIGVAVLVNFLFWFILMPARPGMAFVRGVKSYNRRCHRILLTAKQTFDEGHLEARRKKYFDRDLRRLTESRRVIEIQMNDILNTYPSLTDLFEMMKIDLFSDERATRLLVNDIEDLSIEGYAPPMEVRKALSDLIGALAGWVESPISEDRRKDISDRLDILKDMIHTYESDQSSKAWIVGLGIFYIDGRMLMESVIRFMANFNQVSIKVRERKEKKTRILPQRKSRPPLPMTTIFGRWKISIPSLMAIQALTAAFIALGIAELIGLSSIVQSFWFALLTVSGSLGATKVNSLSRVIGTALGIGVGLILGFVAGEAAFVSVGFILILFFIMVFTRTLSLNWFILCIVSISVVSMALLGADFVEVAKLLMVSSLIGVGAALLATTVLFPIRVRERYIMAFSGYLATADRYLKSFNEQIRTGKNTATIDGSSDLEQKQAVLEASSKENLYEANPFSSVDRENSYDMTTALQTLHSALVGLRHKQQEGMIDQSRLEFISSLIGVISRNIAATCNVLDSKVVHGSDVIFDDGKDFMHALEGQDIKWSADVGVTLFRSYLKDLLQVHGIILELGQGIVKERM